MKKLAAAENPPVGFKLKEICDRLEVNYDDARHLLAKGVLPAGVASVPGRGNHRIFNNRQAFMLSIILRLRAAGISLGVAQQISEWSAYVLQIASNEGWDLRFGPHIGQSNTDRRWFVDIGDIKFGRVATDANPSVEGLYEGPWHDLQLRTEQPKSLRPAVIFRTDLVCIGQLLNSEPS